MPKAKKRKTNHNKASTNNGELTQAEIWDDSALIRIWNDASAEYETYHSIRAKGEDLEEILRRAEEAESNNSTSVAVNADKQMEDRVSEDGEIEDGEVESENDTALDALESNIDAERHASDLMDEVTNDLKIVDSEIGPQAFPQTQNQEQVSTSAITNPTPAVDTDTLQSQAQSKETSSLHQHSTTISQPTVDQTLENVKMAYYWAGYYSGLHDAQRQTTQQQAPQP